MGKHTYTDKDYYYYDETLTQTLLNQYVSTINPANSNGTHFVYLNNAGTMSAFTGSRHTPNPEVYSGESEEERPSTTTSNYENFTAAVNVNFAEAWSAASAFGSGGRIPNYIELADSGTYANNITFAPGGEAGAYGDNTRLNDLTFTDGGSAYLGSVYDREEWVVLSSTPLGDVGTSTTVYYATTGQKLNGLRAKKDFGELYLQTGARASATDVVVSRSMHTLNIANDSGNHNVKNRTGEGTVVNSVTVSGALDRVHVGSGASLNMLTVGLQRSWTSADLSAFGYFSSSYAGTGGRWVLSSATDMQIASGGTASNIYLNNGGQVTVMGPEDRVSSTWVEDSNGGHYDVTTSYASGTGGTLTNLQMAMSGGLQFGGLEDCETWTSPNSVYLNSSSYQSHFYANAPQSAYVEFQSNTVGSNISIGQGGSMRISSGASVVNISMGALTTSTFHTNDGKQMTWVGDRGGKLTVYGGFASNVVVEGANVTPDLYFAKFDHFYTLSSSIQRDYYDQHSSYLDDKVASASAAAGYNAYMSGRYQSAYQSNYMRYYGGEVDVNYGGTIANLSGFAFLGAGDGPIETFSGGSVIRSAMAGEVVSKAVGALSATVEVYGGAHLTSITVAGGHVTMGANAGGVERWANQSNAQSNYALIENLDLRTSGLVGSNNSAVVFFGGANYSGQHSEPVMSNGSQVYGSWTYYNYECMDPGEIHYLTADKGLVVRDAGWGGQDFTYTGSGAVTINGLGTVVLSGYHSRGTSDSYYGKGPYLYPAENLYYFGVVKGVYDEANGSLIRKTILNGEAGFDWTGTLVVGSGGVVQDVGSKAGLKTANTLTSDSWNPVIENDVSKKLVLVAGGSADNVTVTGRVTNYEITSSSLYRSNAALLVSSGATATNISVLSGGMAMAEGGTIDNVFVGNGGLLYLSGWAGAAQVSDDYGTTLAGPQYLDTTVLNAVRLDSGGQLAVTLDWGFRKGHAPSVIANKGGGIMNGVTANGVAYVSGLDYAGAITLTKDQQALDVTVRGFNTITSRDAEGNPTAYTTTIASLNVSSGGIVKNATVGEEGAIYVSEGANVSGLSASGGRIIFENAGSGWNNYLPGSAAVNGMAVLDGGILEVNSKFGLTATNMQIGESAGLEVTIAKDADEDYAKTELNGTWQTTWGGGTFQTNDGVLTGFGGQFGYEYRDLFYSSAYTSARLSMTFLNGAVLSGGDLRGYGFVAVRNGGKIINTHLRGITGNIGVSGYASGLTATTESTGSAYDTNIYVYGSGALAENTVLSGGFLSVEGGGTVNGITMMAPEGYNGPAGDAKTIGPAEMEIMAGGRANNAVASAGLITIYNGSYKDAGVSAATLSNADIHSAATLLVNEDGVVLDGTLNLGGTVVTTAERYEWIEVEVTDPDTGDVYTDWQRVTKNNAVANASTLTVNFDLTEREGTEEGAMIDNLANLQGATLGTITVSAGQAVGRYVLAQGAEDFTGTISVKVDGDVLGDFSVGTIWQYTEDTVFMLTNNANMGLTFAVQTSTAAVENIIATVDGQELLKGQWTNKAVTIKTSVNQYTKSIWYKIKKAVVTRGNPADDGWTLLDNDTGVTVSEYCSVDFMALDAAGRQSRVVTYTVNYDAAAAEITDFRSDAGDMELYEGTESQVSVLVTDDLDEAPTVELQSGADWTALEQDASGRYAFTVSGNGEYTLRATDHAGNVITQTVTVDFYNEVPTSLPTVVSAERDTTDPTNQNVSVSAVFSKNAAKKEYRIGTGEWLDYTQPVVVEENASVFFRAWNLLGYSENTVEVVVDNIDKVPPEAPTAAANTTDPTCQGVIIIITYSEDSTTREYSFDGENWLAYDAQTGVTMAENGTVYFRGRDAAGNWSEIASYEVTNIDKTAPDAPTAVADITELTAQDVTVSATFSDDSAKREYSLDGGETWLDYEDQTGVVMEDIGTVCFRGIDAAGNVSEVTEFEVGNIVKNPPPQPAAEADVTALTNQNVTVSAAFSQNTTAKEYSLDGETWLAYTDGVVVSENDTTVYFRAGNVAGYSDPVGYKVENIDKVPPEAPTAAANTTDPTCQGVIIIITYSEDSTTREYSFDGQTWLAYDAQTGVTMAENGTVYFRGRDAAGNWSEVASYEVTNIDKTAPAAPVAAADVTAPTQGNVSVSAVFSDDSDDREYSLDGENWQAYTQPVVMADNGSVYFRSIDAAGNVSEITEYPVNNIDRVPPEAPDAAASPIVPTNRNVTVVATFSGDSTLRQFSLDGQTWQAYEDGVVMEDNGSVFFRSIDAAGNISAVTEYAVANIDRTPPAAPSAIEVTVFEDRARVDWDDVADDGIAPLAGYGIRYGSSANLSGDGERVDESMKQLTDLAPGDWYYQVRTYDSAGNASDWSELRSFKIEDSSVNKLNVLSGSSSSEVLTHDSEGNIVVYDTATGTAQTLGTLDRSQWDIIGTGKETGGGVPELLVKNRESGAVYLTDNAAGTVNDASVQGGTLLGIVPAGAELAGVGSFNGSSRPGALLIEPEQQHGSSKETRLDCWTVTEEGQVGAATLGSIFTTWDGAGLNIPSNLTDEAEINSRYYSFDVAGIGDFNGDGKDDVMIRNTMPKYVDGKRITGAGDIFVCLTGFTPQNGEKINAVYTGCAPDPWRIAGFGDLNGDGITDVVLENTSDGEIASWLLNSSGQYASAAHIGTLSVGQAFAGVGDVDNDKVADVLFTDFDGSLHAWTVQNGTAKGQIALS